MGSKNQKMLQLSQMSCSGLVAADKKGTSFVNVTVNLNDLSFILLWVFSVPQQDVQYTEKI